MNSTECIVFAILEFKLCWYWSMRKLWIASLSIILQAVSTHSHAVAAIYTGYTIVVKRVNNTWAWIWLRIVLFCSEEKWAWQQTLPQRGASEYPRYCGGGATPSGWSGTSGRILFQRAPNGSLHSKASLYCIVHNKFQETKLSCFHDKAAHNSLAFHLGGAWCHDGGGGDLPSCFNWNCPV